jgi:hypothetical protein
VHLTDDARQRALQLVEGHGASQWRDGVHQIGDRLGLRQVDPAVEKATQREFAGLGQPSAALGRRGHDGPQNHGAPVRAQLDDILPCVRVRAGKIRDHRVIDRRG